MPWEWSWETANWSTLPEVLQQIEVSGWEVFAVCPIGEMDKYVHIVKRRDLSRSAEEEDEMRL